MLQGAHDVAKLAAQGQPVISFNAKAGQYCWRLLVDGAPSNPRALGNRSSDRVGPAAWIVGVARKRHQALFLLVKVVNLCKAFRPGNTFFDGGVVRVFGRFG